jgi:NAD(P)-dependent dehydrogenase (short-subunit alcohol dehydrogenase family)
MGRLDNKVAIVTGGAGGIGAAAGRALAGEGASVAIVDIDGTQAEEVAQDIAISGGSAFSVTADLSEETEVMSAITAVVTRYGRLDVLHNNAALTESELLCKDKEVTGLSVEAWERTMGENMQSKKLM